MPSESKKFWRLSWDENPWSPNSRKPRVPKAVRKLQQKFLSGEMTFEEYGTELDKIKDKA
jgi:hypothetical protein